MSVMIVLAFRLNKDKYKREVLSVKEANRV